MGREHYYDIDRVSALPDFDGMADLDGVFSRLKKIGRGVGKGVGKGLKKGARLGLKAAKYGTPAGLTFVAGKALIKNRKKIGRALKKGAKLSLKVAQYGTAPGLAFTASKALVKNRKKIGRAGSRMTAAFRKHLKKAAKVGLTAAKYGTPFGLQYVAGKAILKGAKKAFGRKKPRQIRQPNGEILDVEATADKLRVPEEAVIDAAVAANKAGSNTYARAKAVDDVERAYGLRDDALTEVVEDVHDEEGPGFTSTDPGDNEADEEEGLQADAAEDATQEHEDDLEGETLEDDDTEEDEGGGDEDGGDEDGSDAGDDEGGDDEPGEIQGLGDAQAARRARRNIVRARSTRARVGRPAVQAMGLVLRGRRLQMHGMGGPFSFVKKAGRGIGRGAKAVGKGIGKGAKIAGKGAVAAAKAGAKVGLQVGKQALSTYLGRPLDEGGGTALTVPDQAGGSSINFKSPIVLGGAAAVVVGGAYLLTRKKT